MGTGSKIVQDIGTINLYATGRQLHTKHLELSLHTYCYKYYYFIIINCKWDYTQWQCATMQDRTIQYYTITHITEYHTHIAQNNKQHSRQPSICKIKRQNQEHILHTIKTQKQVEPKIDESVIKTTRYTK